MAICLVFERGDMASVVKKILPKLHQPVCLVRWPEDAASLIDCDDWMLWLPDQTLRVVVQVAMQSESCIHILPHEKSPHTNRGFCLPSSLEQCEWSLEKRRRITLDALLCGDQLVLNKIVIGKAFSFQPGGHSHSALQRFKTVLSQLERLKEYRPQAFQLTTTKHGQLDTAAVGIACSPHVLRSNLSKQLLSENYANDGLFYSLVVAPKSIVEMLKFLVAEPFSTNVRQPGFLGILRSKGLKVSSREEFDYRLDEVEGRAKQLELDVAEKAVKIAVEPQSLLLDSGVRHKEIRRVKNLHSSKESIAALISKPLPLITHAAAEDFRELYQQMRENAQVTSTFLILMVLSTLMASFGLYANSAPVIIGAMILAPLMAPIVSLSMAFARQDDVMLIASFKTLGIGFLLAIGFAMLLSFLMPLQIETAEITARLRPTLLDLGVAILSGIASAYAYARAHVAKSLAGVAIAVALVPPLAVTGIGLGWFSAKVAGGALLLFLTNLAGIVFSASATFLLMGYAPFSRARKGLIISLTAVLIVSVPLALSFTQLSREGAIVSALEHYAFDDLSVRHVQVFSVKEPLNINLELVTKKKPEDVNVAKVKALIERELGSEVILEVHWVLQY